MKCIYCNGNTKTKWFDYHYSIGVFGYKKCTKCLSFINFCYPNDKLKKELKNSRPSKIKDIEHTKTLDCF